MRAVLRALLLIGLGLPTFASAATPPLPPPPSLSTTAGGRVLSSFAVRDGRIVGIDGTAITTIDQDAAWRLQGDIQGLGPHLDVCPRFTFVRTRLLDRQGVLSHRVTIELARSWAGFSTPPGPDDIGVAMILLRGRPVRISVFPAQAAPPETDTPPVRFILEGEEGRGAPVLLLLRPEGWATPKPLFAEARNNAFVTRMHWESYETLAMLARDIPDPSALSRTGTTLLHLAAEGELPEACRALLAGGARTNAHDRKGALALDRALFMAHNHSVAAIARALNPESKLRADGFAWALDHDDIDSALALFVGQSLRSLSDPVIGKLIELAAEGNRSEVLRLLHAQHIVMPQRQRESSTYIRRCDEDTILALIALQTKEPTTRKLHFWLRDAAAFGNLGAVEALLTARAAPDLSDMGGDRPLMLAANAGHTAVVKRLLAAGADPNAPGRDRRTALSACVEKHDLACVQDLLGAGASISNPGTNTNTALAAALTLRSKPIAEALAGAGARINTAATDAAAHIEGAIALDCLTLLQRAVADGWDPGQLLPSGLNGFVAAHAYAATAALDWLHTEFAQPQAGTPPAWPASPVAPECVLDAPLEDIRPCGGLLPSAGFRIAAILDERGSLTFARVIESDDPRVDAHILATLAQRRYRPVLVNGSPTACRVELREILPARDDSLYMVSVLDVPPHQLHTVRLRRPATATVETNDDGDILRKKEHTRRATSAAGKAPEYWAKVRYVVERDGRPSNIEVISASHPILYTSAVSAVEQFRFSPGEQHGVTVRTVMETTID